MDIMVDMVSDTMVDTTVDTMATPTTDTMARGLLMLSLLLPLLLMPRLIPGMDTTVDTTTVATHTMAMVTDTATTGASKKGVIKSRADGHEVPTVFDDDLPNVLNFREESKRTKQNILLLQTHCIKTFIHFIHWYICIPVTTFRTSRKNEKCVVLVSDFIQRLRIKCRCLTKESFNIKGKTMLPIF